jgi:uncharacterized protein (TIGR02145 family)
MTKILISIIFLFISLVSFSQKILDADGNSYSIIKIKDQLWFESNLKTTRYTNGEKIIKTNKSTNWSKKDTSAQCMQIKKNKRKSTFYNWYVVNDKRGVCPAGWRVPSQKDFNELILSLGGTEKAGLVMKNLSLWGDTTKTNQTNSFNAIPSGFIDAKGKISQENVRACWWSLDEQYKETAYSYSIGNMGTNIIRDKFYKKQGHTIRCMKNIRED